MLIFENTGLQERITSLQASNRELIRQLSNMREQRDFYKKAYEEILMKVLEYGKKEVL